MKKLSTFLKIEYKLFIREKANVFYILLLPVLLLLVFGYVFNYRAPQISIDIVNCDKSDYSTKLISIFRGYHSFDTKVTAAENSDSYVQKSKRDIVMIIPEGFGESISNGEYVPLELYNKSNDASAYSYMLATLENFKSTLTMYLMDYDGLIGFRIVNTENDLYSYPEFLLPGIIAMIILSLGLYNIGLKLTIYREFNQLKVYHVFKVDEKIYFLTHVVFNLIVIIIQTLIVLILGMIFFKVRLPVHFLMFTATILLSSIAFIAIGFLLASFFKSYGNAMSVISFLYFPMLLFSGVYFSMDTLPSFVKILKYFSPATYCVENIRGFYIGDFSTGRVVINSLVLAAISVVCILVSLRKFSWYKK